MSESGSFETTGESGYLDQGPSPKRARFDEQELGEAEYVEEGEVQEDGSLTVPQTQFEIEINSHQEGGSPSDGIGEIHAQDLGGPAFGVIHDAEDLPPLNTTPLTSGVDSSPSPMRGDDSSTMHAIGRALLQMQQQHVISDDVQTGGLSHSQLVITNVSGTDSGQHSSGPLYVMIPPSSSAEILQAMGQSRPIAPKLAGSTSPTSETSRRTREAQRKATHNEVERRRRDRINDMIKTLAQVVPGCQKKDATTGNIVGYVYSKGTVLDKTVEFLKELISQNEQLASTAKLAEKSANALSLLQNQITVLEKENAFLRAQIIQLGIDAANNSQSNLNRQLLSSPLAQSLLNTATGGTQAQQSPTHAATQQLLLSLAQSLTNSPLLAQNLPNPANISLTPSPLPSTPTPASLTNNSPPRLTPSQLTTTHFSTPHQLVSSLPTGGTTITQSSPFLSSLVQTLASIASTTTTQATPLPKVSLPTLQSHGQAQPTLSAAAAASLLNTLLMAQNVLSGANSNAQGSAGLGESPSNNIVLGIDTGGEQGTQ